MDQVLLPVQPTDETAYHHLGLLASASAAHHHASGFSNNIAIRPITSDLTPATPPPEPVQPVAEA